MSYWDTNARYVIYIAISLSSISVLMIIIYVDIAQDCMQSDRILTILKGMNGSDFGCSGKTLLTLRSNLIHSVTGMFTMLT